MKLVADVIQCDRCKAQSLPLRADEAPGLRTVQSYTLQDHAARGGPVLDLCGICRREVDAFARGNEDWLKNHYADMARESLTIAVQLDEIVKITGNSAGADPVACVRHLQQRATEMVAEITKLYAERRGEPYRG